jgi:hypothetical protein
MVALTLTNAGNRVQKQNSVLDPELVTAMFASMSQSELESALEGIERLAGYATLLTRRNARRRDG